MPVFDIYSKLEKRHRDDMPDAYSYDALPEPLKVQIVQIVLRALGNHDQYYDHDRGREVRGAYMTIVGILRTEHGVFCLDQDRRAHENSTYLEELLKFFLSEPDVERCLDVVELVFDAIDKKTRRHQYLFKPNANAIADDALRELNVRFQEHGLGYRFENGRIHRIDSEFIHSEMVKPALALLSGKHYAGAQDEFQKAHEHYRAGRAKEALDQCLKAFESTMKTVCDRRKWLRDRNATAKKLLDVCFANGLIPAFWQQHYASLRSLLESSVPTGRNKLSGHGQGSEPTTVPMHLVGYMLHMTAAAILFIAESDKQMGRQ